MLIDAFRIAIESMKANKVRATLTMLGIIIGITAVIASLAVGQGAQSSVLSKVQGLGSGTINILPIANFNSVRATALTGSGITLLDYRIVPLLENPVTFKEIQAISPEAGASYDITFDSHTVTEQAYGVVPAFFAIRQFDLTSGRFITDADNSKYIKNAVLGSNAATKLFGESDPEGKDIRIKGLTFKVVGVLQAKGNSQFDERVYVPLNVATSFLTGNKNYTEIAVKVSSDDQVDNVSGKIEKTMMNFYKITDPNKEKFSIISSKDILSITGSITGIFTVLLSSIAGISLVVGGIGIMNIMLVSVSERTKEIGLRKAVGAKQRAILMQFLIEAVVLTLIGGIFGITFGALIGFLIGQVGGFPAQITLESVTLAVSVSAIIGLVFGFYPAYRAAKLNPIDALRYE